MRLFLLSIILYSSLTPAYAAVDIAPRGKSPVRLEDVYQQGGVPYVAVEDALDAVGLTGHWNPIKHVFRIRSQRGWAEISPASGFMKLGDQYYPLQDKPRFIDGRLRVTDRFVLNQLAMLVGRQIYFSNLDPETDTAVREDTGSLEQLFAFLLNKKVAKSGPLIRAVAIDPGHGGLDAGVISANGLKEKQINLQLAERLTKQLKMKLGVPIYLSRDGDYELTMEQRVKPASRDDVDLWLLIHAQASFSTVPEGVCLFVRPEAVSKMPAAEEVPENIESDSLKLARQLALALRQAAIKVQGIYPSPLLSLGQGDLPTVQIELGYLSHPEEAARLQTEEYQDQLAQALYLGVRNYAKLKKEP